MHIDVIARDSSMEVLPPEETEQQREQIRQQALADSARGLSIDERYILRRLVSVVSQNAVGTHPHWGALISIPVKEFAARTGITPKIARRRLDVAVHALFGRVVKMEFYDWGTDFCWVTKISSGEEFVDLEFSNFFLEYLKQVVGGVNVDTSKGLLSFADALNEPVAAARGTKIPADLSVVLISRLQARGKRPKSLKWHQLSCRVRKRLRKHLTPDEIEEVMQVAENNSPQARLRRRHYNYSHRDIDGLFDWIMGHKDKPDFTED
ncbi:RepB family plasmid replication initiator protein [Duganella fentianensis]|uniref:RepB family plasmid replication initiator protein n=1 Tax=Duganella fentianensis TaxID=2692177 RepID=UPI0032B1B843